MKIAQKHGTDQADWRAVSANGVSHQAQVAFVFGDTNVLKQASLIEEAHRLSPRAQVVGCSTAGEIVARRVFDNSLTATAVFFETAPLQFAQTTLGGMADSFDAGTGLAEALSHESLVHVFVLSDGLHVNGSAPAQGLRRKLPPGTAVTGGLAGDQNRFQETVVFLDTPSGEICPVGPAHKQAELHNQTMTITTFSERSCRP
jgi:hypothetical protein